MKRKLLSALFCLCMVVALLPTTAMAAGTGVTVAGTDVSAGGYWSCTNNAMAVSDETNYNVKYDPSTTTLTLKNFSWSGSGNGIYSDVATLTIVVDGENAITTSSGYGIYSSRDPNNTTNSNLTITGSSASEDSLTITSSSDGIFAYEIFQSYQESITIAGVTISVTSSNGVGIAGSKSLTIRNSVINSTGSSHGLQGGKFESNEASLTIENSTIIATATGSGPAIKEISSLTYTDGYHWRTSASGDYTNSTSTEFSNDGSLKYVELIPGLYTPPAPTTYTVTFHANGQGTAPTAQEITAGEKATEPTAPTASGYTFGGWYTDADCTEEYDFDTVVTNNLDLYAKWTENAPIGWEANTSILYQTHIDKNYTGLLVEIDDAATVALLNEADTTYGVEIGSTQYPATSPLIAGAYIVDVGGLNADDDYTAKPYYTKGGTTCYAGQFSFSTVKARTDSTYDSYHHRDYYAYDGDHVAIGYGDEAYGNGGAVDFIGHNGTTWLRSTYKDGGWAYKFGDDNTWVETNGYDVTVYNKNGIQAWVVPTTSDDGYFGVLSYYIRNISDGAVEDFKFGAAADIMIDTVDSAPIARTDYGISMTDNTNTFALICRDGFNGIETPVNTLWFGAYGSAKNNVYSDVTGDSYASGDSGAAYSWNGIDLEPGEIKCYTIQLGIGDADDLANRLNGSVDYIEEKLQGLTANTTYEITIGSNTYVVTADSEGEIPLVGTDNNDKAYDLIGKTITIVEQGNPSASDEIEIAPRPNPESPDIDNSVPDPVLPNEITVTQTSIAVEAATDQEYSIDGGNTWVGKNAGDIDSNGNVVFSGLTAGTAYTISTRKYATNIHFASETKTFVITTATATLTVTFDVQGIGTAPAAAAGITSGETITAPTAPTANGYRFDGWYEDAACTTAYDFTTPVTSNITLFAKWTRLYSVTFAANGGTGTAPTQEATAEGGTFTLPDNTFTKHGFNFSGWNYGTTTYQPGDTFTMPASNVTFTAQWTIDLSAFHYAYDVQRSPAYPTKGNPMTVSGFYYPLVDVSIRGTKNEGTWTLTEVGTYAEVKTQNIGSDYLAGLISTVASNYKVSADSLKIHQLKDGSSHIAYGIVVAHTNNGNEGDYAVFLGDTWSGGGGYLLTMEPMSDSVTVTPKNDVTDSATTVYTVTFHANGHGTAPAAQIVVKDGLVTFPAVPYAGGYDFRGWYTEADCINRYDFNTPVTADLDLYANWKKDRSDRPVRKETYEVDLDVTEDEEASVSTTHKNADNGTEVTITLVPDLYYSVGGVIVRDEDGKVVKTVDNGDGTFTFTMPTSDVTVEPIFNWENPFHDVDEEEYYAPAVEWALNNEITGGKTGNTFAPADYCTRAQIVTFLWRAAGCPEPIATSSNFTDVDLNSYYAPAVLWAVENGITGGTTETTFSPNQICSRAQAVTFLYRAAGLPEVGTVAEFFDVVFGSYYADAVSWAAENGITGGTTETTFSPANSCTRAQIVTFLYRYLGE